MQVKKLLITLALFASASLAYAASSSSAAPTFDDALQMFNEAIETNRKDDVLKQHNMLRHLDQSRAYQVSINCPAFIAMILKQPKTRENIEPFMDCFAPRSPIWQHLRIGNFGALRKYIDKGKGKATKEDDLTDAFLSLLSAVDKCTEKELCISLQRCYQEAYKQDQQLALSLSTHATFRQFIDKLIQNGRHNLLWHLRPILQADDLKRVDALLIKPLNQTKTTEATKQKEPSQQEEPQTIKIESLTELCARAIARNTKLLKASKELLPPLIRSAPFIEHVNDALLKRIAMQADVLGPHGNHVTCIAVSPDGSTIASGSTYPYTLMLWDKEKQRAPQTLVGHTSGITCAAFSPDGNLIASGSKDRSVRIWNAADSTYIARFHDFQDEIHSIRFSKDGKQLVTALENKALYMWNVETRELVNRLEHAEHLEKIVLGPEGNICASSSADGQVHIWNIATGESKILYNENTHIYKGEPIAFSSNGMWLMTKTYRSSGHYDTQYIFWNLKTGKPVCRDTLWENENTFFFDANSQKAYMCNLESFAMVDFLRCKKNGPIKVIQPSYDNPSSIICMALCPHGGSFATGINTSKVGFSSHVAIYRDYKKDLARFAVNDEVQKLLMMATKSWEEYRPHEVDTHDPAYQIMIERLPYLHDERLFKEPISTKITRFFSGWFSSTDTQEACEEEN